MSSTQPLPRGSQGGRGLSEQVGTGRDVLTQDRDPRGREGVGRHLRAVLRDGESWRATCACGWCSVPLETSDEGLAIPCAIEVEEALSLARRLRVRDGR